MFSWCTNNQSLHSSTDCNYSQEMKEHEYKLSPPRTCLCVLLTLSSWLRSIINQNKADTACRSAVRPHKPSVMSAIPQDDQPSPELSAWRQPAAKRVLCSSCYLIQTEFLRRAFGFLVKDQKCLQDISMFFEFTLRPMLETRPHAVHLLTSRFWLKATDRPDCRSE